MRDPLNRQPRLELPPTPTGFKVWFVFVAVIALVLLGVVVWAAVKVVNHFT